MSYARSVRKEPLNRRRFVANAGSKLSSERARFAIFVGFLVIVLLTGGGSRADIHSLAVLRPVSVLVIAYALTVGSWQQFKSIRVPLLMLTALTIVVASQLLMIPTTIWAELPGREIYAAAAQASGSDVAWRPVSLSVSRTLNSLMALAVPFAALLLLAVQSSRNHRRTAWIVSALATASAAWGLFQIIVPGRLLYFYAITNDGPVGFFANRNHQAVFLAAALPFLAAIAMTDERRGKPIFTLALVGGALAALVALATGSRSGIAMIALSLGTVTLIFQRDGSESAPHRRKGSFSSGLVLKGSLATFVAIAVAIVFFGQDLAFERLYATEAVEEMRFQRLPTLLAMVGNTFPIGTGFGTFDLIYYSYEKTDDLSPYYFNHAHNDWIELLIEGGLASAVLLAVFSVWSVRRGWAILSKAAGDDGRFIRLACLNYVVVMGAASLFDYPIRTPILAAVFAVCCGLLSIRMLSRASNG